MPERDIDLKYIRISPKFTGGELIVREVKPLIDRWLISPERTWEEVDSILEGRLQAIEANLKIDRTPTPMAKQFGLERAPQPAMSKFLAYVELLDEYRMVGEVWNSKIEEAKNEYNYARNDIKTKNYSKGRFDNEIQKLTKEYQRNILPFIQKDRDTETLIGLILRKAVIDVFSIKDSGGKTHDPFIISDFSKILEDSNKNLHQVDRATFSDRNPVDYFINQLTEYLNVSKDASLYRRYAYRETPDLATNKQDCKILETILTFIYGKNETGSQNIQSLENMSKAFLFFLKRQTTFKASPPTAEKYQVLGFIHDLTAAIFSGFDPHIIGNIERIVSEVYPDFILTDLFKKEAVRCVESFGTSFYSISQAAIDKTRDLVLIHNAEKMRISTVDIPKEVSTFICSSDFRLMMGLSILGNFWALQETSLSNRKTLDLLTNSLLKSAFRRWSNDPQWYPLLHLYIQLSDKTDLISRQGIEFVLDDLIGAQRPLDLSKVSEEYRKEIDSSRIDIKKTHQESSHMDRIKYELEMFQAYSNEFWSSDIDRFEIAQKENSFLWKEVLDNATWFVSPRGDRFSRRNNPELNDVALENITFYIEKSLPREHKISINFEGIDSSVILWLDTQRQLLGFNHNLLRIDARIAHTFTNFLLKRLYTITSGLLATPQPPQGLNIGPEGLIDRYVRAHWTFLKTTPGRTITMQSDGARLHAHEVWDEYGIDIFREMKRRKEAGTLREDHYMTFTREVTPETSLKGRLVLPNELKFDPTLIQIPN